MDPFTDQVLGGRYGLQQTGSLRPHGRRRALATGKPGPVEELYFSEIVDARKVLFPERPAGSRAP